MSSGFFAVLFPPAPAYLSLKGGSDMEICHHHPVFSSPAQRQECLSRLLLACLRRLEIDGTQPLSGRD